ncbi:MAG: tRNA uridine-5-carboxymethylaminomethyl(34) synthesis GTPase MnmE [Candidatus Kapaibacteriales bacterium]
MNDTIVALSTPPGISGMAVIRLSGEKAFELIDECFEGKVKITEAKTHTIHYGKFHDEGNLIDFVTIAVFRKPNSYTGEDVAEIACHGGLVVIDQIIQTIQRKGCRLATPGEFTKRAFLNGKIDLTQVEAVADLIHSVSLPAYQTAVRQLAGEFHKKIQAFRKKLLDASSLLELELDFADEGFEFVEREKIIQSITESIEFCTQLASSYKGSEILRSGFYVGIAGYPNSGKSTLFNSLLQRRRAIVSEIPGTTRDYLEEPMFINDILVKLVDTAGVRSTTDIVEIEGIQMGESLLAQSNMIIILNDLTNGLHFSDKLFKEMLERYPHSKILLVHNKMDLYSGEIVSGLENTFFISAKFGTGIDKLKEKIYETARNDIGSQKDVLINQRHYLLLQQAKEELQNALASVRQGLGNELVAVDIRRSVKTLGEIIGESWSEEVLNNIFSRFCIGK